MEMNSKNGMSCFKECWQGIGMDYKTKHIIWEKR